MLRERPCSSLAWRRPGRILPEPAGYCRGREGRVIGFVDRFFDPLAFSLVVGGTGLATWVSATGKDGVRGFAALRPFFLARPMRDAETADRAVRKIQHISEYKGTTCADRV